MKINRLTASFGKLQNDTLRFHEGLNIIYAPNESGKSTWCAFIRAMLYGVDSAERSRAGYLPDKLKYVPWSGAPMEGTMELTADHCDITLTRSTHAKNAPMREFSATYTGSNVPVENMNGSNAGELLTGVTKDVFRRSAFIEQGSVGVKNSPELEKRIAAIVSSGEEDTSFSEADERLRAWQRKRRWNRRGFLPDLEGRMDGAKRLLREMDGSVAQLERLDAELRTNQQEAQRLEQEVIEARKRQRRDALSRLSQGRSELHASSEAHDQAMEQLSLRRQELRESSFGNRSLPELEREVRKDLEELKGLGEPQLNSRRLIPALICFALAVVCAAFYSAYSILPLIIGAGVLCVAAVLLFISYNHSRQKVLAAQERRKQILKKYRVHTPKEIGGALEKLRRLHAAVQAAEEQEVQARNLYENVSRQQNNLEENAIADLDFSTGSSEAARLSRELMARRAKVEQLSSQMAAIRGRLSAIGDPLVLSSSLTCMQEDYEHIQAEYDAITVALEALRDADREIQTRFSPELGKVAARYMSAVTGGRYEDVLINRDFSARTRTKGDVVARDAEYLSAGTLDLMYLAVRLAVCELAMPDGEPCPLILDDALVNLDDTRFKQAIELLKQIARDRQVILFTCRRQDSPHPQPAAETA
ncbi:MAG: AAA family ATPase [Oscillospiraceae bacterium]|nr:AAA family ATPase [Oscillospiraceae bacterium]